MSDPPEPTADPVPEQAGEEDAGTTTELGRSERLVSVAETLMRAIEIVAAYILVVLFAVGVVDLALQIGLSATDGRITDPLVVVGFIDTALLLFIIVEIFQTVVAYTQESSTQRIVQLVIYAGVIAMVRKAIVFRTSEYATLQDALVAAGSYTLILVGLATILFVNHRYLGSWVREAR